MTQGCKWSLLKVKKEKYKGSMLSTGGVWRLRERASLFLVLLKLTLTYAKGEPADSHQTISEWGRAWVDAEPQHSQFKM
jgi:hypothetical protein